MRRKEPLLLMPFTLSRQIMYLGRINVDEKDFEEHFMEIYLKRVHCHVFHYFVLMMLQKFL